MILKINTKDNLKSNNHSLINLKIYGRKIKG